MNPQQQYSSFRWFVFVTLCIVTASTSLALISPAPLMGAIAKSLNISVGEASGVTMGSFTLAVAISALLSGYFLDKFGAARVWIACLILVIIGETLMPLLGGSFWGLNNLRIIAGLGTGPIMASTAQIAAQWFPAKERGLVTGVQGMAMGLGVTAGFIVAPTVFGATGNWAVTMAWLSVMPIVALVMAVVVAFGPKPHAEVMECWEQQGDAGVFMQALKLPVTWLAILTVLAMSWGYQGINDLIPGYIAIEYPVGLGKGPMLAGQFMTTFSLAFVLGSMAGGFILEKILKGQAKIMVFVAYLGSAIFSFGLQVSFVTGNDALLIADLVLLGLFASNCIAPTFAFMAKSYPEHITGKIGGLAQGIGILGGTTGAFAGSYALHVTGFYYASIYIVVIVCILGCLFALGLNTPRQTECDPKN